MINSCTNNQTCEHHNKYCGNGFLIVLVIYILLAIILGNRQCNMF